MGLRSTNCVVGAFVGFGVGTWVGEFVGSESESIGDGVTGNVGKFVRVGRKEIVGNLVLVGYLLNKSKLGTYAIINIHFIKLTMWK